MWIRSQTGELINSKFIERIFAPVESEPESHRVMADMCDGKVFSLAEKPNRDAAELVIKQLYKGLNRGTKTTTLS